MHICSFQSFIVVQVHGRLWSHANMIHFKVLLTLFSGTNVPDVYQNFYDVVI